MHIFIIAALTADGFLADKQDQKSTTWTSKEDFQFFVRKTKEAGVCVMGSKTYQTIGHPLKDRLTIVYTNHPETIPHAVPLDTSYSILDTSKIYTTNLLPDQLINRLSPELAEGLTNHYSQLAICGGSSIYTHWLKSGLVNTLYLTYEPILFGQGIPLFNAPLTQKLKLISTTPLSPQTTLMEYQVT